MLELAKNWPQYTSNCSALAMSGTNSAFLAMPVNHTYLLGHVLFAHVHNCLCMVASRHCTYTAIVCFTAVQSQILDQCRVCAL